MPARICYGRRKLYDHLRTRHVKEAFPFVCSKCHKKFKDESSLQFHELLHLPKSLELLSCPQCNKKCKTPSLLHAHVRYAHHRNYVCEECGKSFGSNGVLKEHKITHTDECPYQCTHCSKKFKNKHRLNVM